MKKKIAAFVAATMMCTNCMGFNSIPEFLNCGNSVVAKAETTIWDGTVDTSWYDGEEKEMHISTAEEFAGFIKLLAGGSKMEGQTIILDKNVFLNDPDEMNEDNETLPANLLEYTGKDFYGTFEGKNHTVYGLYTDTSIISAIKGSASISNLSFENGRIGASLFGANSGSITNMSVNAVATGNAMICSENNGTISSCISDGKISNSSVAGICYINNGIIEKCTNNAQINGDFKVGGIAVKSSGSLISCINNGAVQNTMTHDDTYYDNTGGIVASNTNILTDCINNANINAGYDSLYLTEQIYIGGISGNGSVANCINNGDIIAFGKSSEHFYVGGISGYGGGGHCGNNGNITSPGNAGGITGSGNASYCYNKGNVKGAYYAGGISACSDQLYSSYNTGDVSSDKFAGGLSGRIDVSIKDYPDYWILDSCYSSASFINAPTSGALICDIYSNVDVQSEWVKSSYYLNSGASQAIGNETGEFGTPKSSANMKKEAFAESLGDAFIYNPDGYPMLFWEVGLPMLSIDKTEISFNEMGQQDILTPDTSYEGDLTWTSSDEKVATVDKDGIVTAVGNGTCTIKVEAGGAIASCEVTVAFEYYLNETEMTMKPDLAKELIVYSKSNGEPTTLEVKYSSSNEDVAEVNKRGVVSANAPGTAEIHALVAGMDLVCVVTVEGVKGDVNVDGVFTVADIVTLQKWLLAVPDAKLNNWKAADLCEDNQLNVFDLCLMKHELLK